MDRFHTPLDTDALWNRHENPVSVWWLVLLYPVFVLALYRRSKPLAGVVLTSLAANIFLVAPPDADDAWATRVVRGERVWIDRHLRSSDAGLALTVIGAVVNVYTLRAALHRRPVRTALGTVASMVLMVLFFDRMADLYESTLEGDTEGAGSQ